MNIVRTLVRTLISPLAIACVGFPWLLPLRAESLIAPIVEFDDRLFGEHTIDRAQWIEEDVVLVTTRDRSTRGGAFGMNIWSYRISNKEVKHFRSGIIECLDVKSRRIVININNEIGRATNAKGPRAWSTGIWGHDFSDSDEDRRTFRINPYSCEIWQVPADRHPAEKMRAGYWTIELHEPGDFFVKGTMNPRPFQPFKDKWIFVTANGESERSLPIPEADLAHLTYVPHNDTYFIAPHGNTHMGITLKGGEVIKTWHPPSAMLEDIQNRRSKDNKHQQHLGAIVWKYGLIWGWAENDNKGAVVSVTEDGDSLKIIETSSSFRILDTHVSPSGCLMLATVADAILIYRFRIFDICRTRG